MVTANSQELGISLDAVLQIEATLMRGQRNGALEVLMLK
jgi:hypothetical protein